ncbi:MAG: histidine kinase [Kiritimatiellae bacterium]|jgi:PAS domain S-box-containing protein|nr:histidine kinase [Kiritimatiellia bacterium]
MTSDRDLPHSYDTLRLRAEQCREAGGGSFNSGPTLAVDAQRLLHELEVHQIELEMQNVELQKARNEAEEARVTYQNLYDFAPVGYFTLSREGSVLMANLPGASLLGTERGALTGHPFSQWVAPDKRADFKEFLDRVFEGEGPVSMELDIQRRGEEGFIANLEAREGEGDQGCRMILTDITQRKAGEEADRRLKISTRSNRKLKGEILHRKEVEATLETAQGRLDQSLEKSERQRKRLRTLTHALLNAQEEERKRISRELHDGIVQALVVIQYEFELLSQGAEDRFPGLHDQISRSQDILERSIDLVHDFAFDLRPSVLDNLGLGPALETFAARFQESTGITVTLDLFEDIGNIGSPEHSMLYRVVQEAFTNVSTHAQAQNVRLSIHRTTTGIRMEITDDGVGIDLEKSESSLGEGRLGLVGMKERVEMLGGFLDVHSKPGEYTTIQVDLPDENPLLC